MSSAFGAETMWVRGVAHEHLQYDEVLIELFKHGHDCVVFSPRKGGAGWRCGSPRKHLRTRSMCQNVIEASVLCLV